MLIIALIASAFLGICQEQMYINYGKNTKEAMFVVVGFRLSLVLILFLQYINLHR